KKFLKKMAGINKNCKMLKKVFLFGLITIVLGCEKERKFPEVKDLSQYPKTEFITTLETKINTNKNSVYCVTMLYAWNEVKNIVNAPFKIDSNFNHLALLNNSTSFK